MTIETQRETAMGRWYFRLKSISGNPRLWWFANFTTGAWPPNRKAACGGRAHAREHFFPLQDRSLPPWGSPTWNHIRLENLLRRAKLELVALKPRELTWWEQRQLEKQEENDES
jgi:hypothetical protein